MAECLDNLPVLDQKHARHLPGVAIRATQAMTAEGGGNGTPDDARAEKLKKRPSGEPESLIEDPVRIGETRQVGETVAREQGGGPFVVGRMDQNDPGAGALDLLSQASQVGETLAAESTAQMAQTDDQSRPSAR